MKKHVFLFPFLLIFCFSFATAQNGYWQQHVDYTMSIDVDVEAFAYSGEQSLIYTNNSPDTLQRVFYHLYYNAFKPGSGLEAAQNLEDAALILLFIKSTPFPIIVFKSTQTGLFFSVLDLALFIPSIID